jgi:hypothetical protein
MAGEKTYGRAEKAKYQPPPCPHCGSTRVRVNWIEISDRAKPEPDFIPGQLECLDCHGLAR